MHLPIVEHRTVVRTLGGLCVIIVCIAGSGLRSARAQDRWPFWDPALAKRLLSTAHEKLKQKGIPFDPNTVVEDGWQQRIDPALLDLPEMKRNLRVTEPMKGVYLADTLLVGEEVKLEGDTVLLIKELAPDDENRNLKISGKGDFIMFIVGSGKKLPLGTPYRGTIVLQTSGRCFVAGFPQGYTVLIGCGRIVKRSRDGDQ